MSSIQITTPSGVTNAVTTPLSGTASGLNFPQLSIYDNGAYVGPVGVYDGKWSITVSPAQGDNAYTAVGNATSDPGVASGAVTLTDVQAPPTITVAQPGGNTNAPVQTLSGTATTAGSGARFTAGTVLTLSDDGTALGHAVVATDGTWSAQVALTGQGANLVKVVGTDVAGNTGEADVGFVLKTGVPAVAITSAGGAVSQAQQLISGIATAGDTGDVITVVEDGSAIGTAAVGGDGTWALATTLAAGAHSFQATDADQYGNVGDSNAVAYTLNTAPAAAAPAPLPPAATPPTVAFDSAPQLVGGSTATLSGTASDAVGVTGVEIYEGAAALGAAQVNGDGTWTFSHDFGQGSYDQLTAVATDPSGLSAGASALYHLVTGLSGRSIGEVTTLDASGAVISATTTAADGSIGAQTVSNRDGTATSTGYENGQKLFSIGNDVMTGNGYREDFVFQPTMGHARITDFVVAGAGHDTLTLSHGDFDTVAQVLAHTTMNHGSAVIHVTPDDTIRLAGVTKAQLAQHRADFAFTA